MACLLDTLFPLRHRVDSSNRNEIPLSKSSPLFQTSPIFLHFVALISNIFISLLDQTFTTTQVKSNNINIAIWKKYLQSFKYARFNFDKNDLTRSPFFQLLFVVQFEKFEKFLPSLSSSTFFSKSDPSNENPIRQQSVQIFLPRK